MNDYVNIQDHLADVKNLLVRHKLVEDLVHKQNLTELRRLLDQLGPEPLARILEALSADDLQIIWQLVPDEQKEEILLEISDNVRVELVTQVKPVTRSMMSRVFDLHEGRLREIVIETREDLAQAKPVWIDLVMPDDEHLAWARE